MDRRQIHHVEAQVGDGRQAAGCLSERRAARRVGPRRPRKHLVPGAGARALPIDPHAIDRRGRGRRPVRIHVHHRREIVGRGDRHAAGDRSRVGDGIRPRRQPGRVGASAADLIRAGRRFAHRQLAFQQLQRNVLAGFELHPNLAAPRLEPVDPCEHGVFVPPGRRDVEAAGPFVGARVRQDQRRFPPALRFHLRPSRRGGPVPEYGDDHVMAVGEQEGRDVDELARRALDGEAAAVDDRTDLVDDSAAVGSR